MSLSPDSGYLYQKLTSNNNKNIGAEEVLVKTWHYKFRTIYGIRYNVDIEEFKYELFILKFYQDKHKSHPDKYRFMTGENDCWRIFSTILNITMEVYKKYPKGSFGFVGARSLDETTREKTKRWVVYKRIMAQYFDPNLFKHAPDPKRSLFVALNKQMEAEVPQLWEKVLERMEQDFLDYEESRTGGAFTGSTG